MPSKAIDKARFAALCVLLPLLATGYQIAAKALADGPGHGAAAYALIALLLTCEIGSFVLWMYVLARVPLSQAFPLTALSYVFVIAASYLLFREGLSLTQLAGGALILAGAWLVRGTPEAGA